jgi:hypothetical protein
MKRRFQDCGIEIVPSSQVILMQVPAAAEADPNAAPRRAAR